MSATHASSTPRYPYAIKLRMATAEYAALVQGKNPRNAFTVVISMVVKSGKGEVTRTYQWNVRFRKTGKNLTDCVRLSNILLDQKSGFHTIAKSGKMYTAAQMLHKNLASTSTKRAAALQALEGKTKKELLNPEAVKEINAEKIRKNSLVLLGPKKSIQYWLKAYTVWPLDREITILVPFDVDPASVTANVVYVCNKRKPFSPVLLGVAKLSDDHDSGDRLAGIMKRAAAVARKKVRKGSALMHKPLSKQHAARNGRQRKSNNATRKRASNVVNATENKRKEEKRQYENEHKESRHKRTINHCCPTPKRRKKSTPQALKGEDAYTVQMPPQEGCQLSMTDCVDCDIEFDFGPPSAAGPMLWFVV